MGGSGGDSSGEEDGDAEWRAAINSVSSSGVNGGEIHMNGGDNCEENNHYNPQKLKHYQIKAQKLLDDILEKTIELEVVSRTDIQDDVPSIARTGVRLFREAPPGIVFDHRVELQGPTKKPRIIPGEEIDEKSKKFKQQLQSVAVEGAYIIAAARDSHKKSLTKLEAKDAAKKAAAKREEERIAELKKVRGEKWLRSIARDMRVKFAGR